MTSTEIIRTDQAPPAWISLLGPAAELAKTVAMTEFVPSSLRGKPASIAACIMTAHELGVGPMTALSQIAIVDGRPCLSATLMRGLALSRGHEIAFEDATTQSVTCVGRRRNSDMVTRVKWSMADARSAGIAGKQNWQKYPRAMLEARASAELCRLIFADVIGGLTLSLEEVEDGLDTARDLGGAEGTEGGNGREPAPTTKRRRAALTAPQVVDAPPAEEPPLPDADPPASTTPPTVNGGTNQRLPVPAAAPEVSREAPAVNETEPPSVKDDAQSPRMRRLHALFRQVGITERDDRLSFARHIANRGAEGAPIESSNDLTDVEVDAISNNLQDHVEGRAYISKNPDDSWSVATTAPAGEGEDAPPPDPDDLADF